MANRKLATILRCTGLALLVLGVFALLPAVAEAQLHGFGILKGCSASTNCNDDLDCDNALFCDGVETCGTPSATEPTVLCTIRATNNDEFGDSFTLRTACDRIKPGALDEFVDCTIEVTAVQDNGLQGDTTCAIGQILGSDIEANNCVIGPGDSVTFTSDNYQIQSGDPAQLPDQATVGGTDNCDGTPSTDCSQILNNQQATSQTVLTDNCIPGTPPCAEDPDLCTTITCNEETDGCDTGVVQCPDDTDLCNGTPVCDPTSGLCDPGTPVQCPDDADLCNGTPVCVPGTGLCDPGTAVVCDDPCFTCEPTSGICDVPSGLPECDDNEEICRTPGFWGTHGGIEKGGPNVTGTVLDLYGGNLSICGQPVTTVDLSDTSAIQAICVSPKGDSNLQLARQLTAAALNCIVSNSTSCEGAGQDATNVCGGTSIADLFAECNAVCADSSSTQQEITDCIGAIDCFNNGGASFDPATDICSGDSGCHDRSLGCVGFENTGPASSPRKCNDARKDDETIF